MGIGYKTRPTIDGDCSHHSYGQGAGGIPNGSGVPWQAQENDKPMRVYLGMLGHYASFEIAKNLTDLYLLVPEVVFLGRSICEVVGEIGLGDWRFDSVLSIAPVNSPVFDPGPTLAGGTRIINYMGNGDEYLVIREMVVGWIPEEVQEEAFGARPAVRPLRAIMAP